MQEGILVTPTMMAHHRLYVLDEAFQVRAPGSQQEDIQNAARPCCEPGRGCKLGPADRTPDPPDGCAARPAGMQPGRVLGRGCKHGGPAAPAGSPDMVLRVLFARPACLSGRQRAERAAARRALWACGTAAVIVAGRVSRRPAPAVHLR